PAHRTAAPRLLARRTSTTKGPQGLSRDHLYQTRIAGARCGASATHQLVRIIAIAARASYLNSGIFFSSSFGGTLQRAQLTQPARRVLPRSCAGVASSCRQLRLAIPWVVASTDRLSAGAGANSCGSSPDAATLDVAHERCIGTGLAERGHDDNLNRSGVVLDRLDQDRGRGICQVGKKL